MVASRLPMKLDREPKVPPNRRARVELLDMLHKMISPAAPLGRRPDPASRVNTNLMRSPRRLRRSEINLQRK
jgi:hypothetical protein